MGCLPNGHSHQASNQSLHRNRLNRTKMNNNNHVGAWHLLIHDAPPVGPTMCECCCTRWLHRGSVDIPCPEDTRFSKQQPWPLESNPSFAKCEFATLANGRGMRYLGPFPAPEGAQLHHTAGRRILFLPRWPSHAFHEIFVTPTHQIRLSVHPSSTRRTLCPALKGPQMHQSIEAP